MSYIRCGAVMQYVEGESDCYVFERYYGAIEDYDKLSNEVLVELLFTNWKTDDALVKNYLLKKLAEKLNVKLREKPLTPKEAFEATVLNMKKTGALLEDESLDQLTINVQSCGCCLTDNQCICGSEAYYSSEFDAVFCPSCNAWISKKCGGKNCIYCSARPDKPLKKRY